MKGACGSLRPWPCRDSRRHLGMAAGARVLECRHALTVRNVSRAGVDKQPDDLLMHRTAVPKDHRLQKCGPAEIVDVVDVDCSGKQDAHRFGMAVVGRRDESRAAIAVGVGEVCHACGEDELQDLVAAFRARVEEGRVADVVLGIDVRAGRDEEARRLDLVGPRGDEQRRAPSRVAPVDGRATAQLPLEFGNVAIGRGFRQGHRLPLPSMHGSQPAETGRGKHRERSHKRAARPLRRPWNPSIHPTMGTPRGAAARGGAIKTWQSRRIAPAALPISCCEAEGNGLCRFDFLGGFRFDAGAIAGALGRGVAVDELDDGHRGVVALAEAGLHDA